MTTTPTPPFPDRPSATDLRRLLDSELSLGSRLGYVALLLAALGMTAVTGSLLLTEPVLPVRAQVGFVVMTVIGLCWSAFATWVLTHKRVLFARHSIVAGRMAVTFTTVFVIGAFTLAATTGQSALYGATAGGLVMLAGAVVILTRAHRNFDQLMERRKALEQHLGRNTA